MRPQAIRKEKTDKLDSIRIANYGLDNWFKLKDFQSAKAVYDELKFIGRQNSHYIKIKIDSKLVLGGILDCTMQGIKSLLSRNGLIIQQKINLVTL